MGDISKPQRKFLFVLLPTILLLRGKMNFRNLSRYSPLCEKTYSRQFRNPFDFAAFNQNLIEMYTPPSTTKVAAMDASFVTKSGKHTFGIDSFFNGSHSKAEKGLEVSNLAIIELESNTGYTLSVKQTPSLDKIRKRLKSDSDNSEADKPEEEKTRIDFYLDHLRQDRNALPTDIGYLVTDGYYTKIKFTTGVVDELNLHQIGKLRCDANLRYLYDGPQKKFGARRKYDGRVKFDDLSRMEYVGEIEKDFHLYTTIVNSVSLKRNIRIAFLLNTRDNKNPKYVILFSTDTKINPKLIYQYYKARFQIEFIFRDAKQFTGLCDCQARCEESLDFHFNASLAALNLAKIEARNEWDQKKNFTFSMASIKTRNFNLHMVDTIISMLELDPNLIKCHPDFDKVFAYGAINA